MKQLLIALIALLPCAGFSAQTADSVERRLIEVYETYQSGKEGHIDELMWGLQWSEVELIAHQNDPSYYRVYYVLSALNIEAYKLSRTKRILDADLSPNELCLTGLKWLNRSASNYMKFQALVAENPMKFEANNKLIANVCQQVYLMVNFDMLDQYSNIMTCQGLMDKTMWLDKDYPEEYWDLRYELHSRIMYGTEKMTRFQEVAEELIAAHERNEELGIKDREYWNTIAHYVHRLHINHYDPKAKEILDEEFTEGRVAKSLFDVFAIRNDGSSALLTTLVHLGYTNDLRDAVSNFKATEAPSEYMKLENLVRKAFVAIGRSPIADSVLSK